METMALLAASVAHDFNHVLCGVRANLYAHKQSVAEDEALEAAESALDHGAG